MRRLISYIAMCGALLLGAGAAFVPTAMNMDTDLAYEEGKTLTFRLYNKEADVDGNGYSPDDEYYTLDETTTKAVNEISDEMKVRLEAWGVTEYDIRTVGTDTITVSFRATNDSATEYYYLERYLAFSGGDIEIDASKDTMSDPAEGYSHDERWKTMIQGQTARIEYIEQNGVSSFPVVVLPIGDAKEDIESLKALVTYCKDNTHEADDENGTSATTCSMILWANRQETDYYAAASTDQNVASRILANESCANDAALWYADSDDDKEYPSIQIIPTSSAITSEGTYDANNATAAYDAARYLVNMINASSLNYGVHFLNASDRAATVESLTGYSAWTKTLSMSKTLISTLIAFAVVAVILALFDRLFALSIVSISASSVYLTFLFFTLLGTQFNIAALLGLAVVGLLSVFGGVYYGAKLKDELYKGRTLKKANTEAAKKALWPTIDAGLLSIIIGFFVYIFAGAVCQKIAIVLVIGGAVSIVMNLIGLRIAAWLLCNDSTLQGKFPALLNVNGEKIPDMLKEEKQTYFGAYEKSDFTKSKKWVYGLMGAILVAGTACMIAFGVTKGTVYNLASSSESTVVYVEARSTKNDYNTNRLHEVSDIYDEKADGESLLANMYLVEGSKETAFSKLYSDIVLADSVDTYYNSETELTYYWYLFKIELKAHYDLDKTYTIKTCNPSTKALVATYDTFQDAFENAISNDIVGATECVVSVKNVVAETDKPDLGPIALGVGVALAVCTIYMMIRFRPSRGLAAGLIATAASFSAVAFFAFTRIATNPVVAVGAIATAVIALVASLFVLNKEKEQFKENREKDKATLENRSLNMKSAVSNSAAELIIFALIAAYICIDFFGFGPASYSSVYLASLIGLALAVVMTLAILCPMSIRFASWLSKIHFKAPKRKKKVGQLQSQKKSAEPEEAVFIGIND